MILESKALSAVSEADIVALVQAQIPEGKRIDYKREMSSATDGDKKEFLFDISSFANASGGHLVYGIEEAAGIPKSIPGLTIIDADAEIRKLQSMILDGIDPRIPGVDLRFIPAPQGKSVLVIHIPKSWALPHMVTFKGTNKFYSRNAAGKHPLDVGELRSLFVSSERITDLIKRFRTERISQIVADETPIQLNSEPKTILHIVPIEAFSSAAKFDLRAAMDLSSGLLDPLGAPSHSTRINLDGLFTYATMESKAVASSYLQLYRTGIIETVDAKTPGANLRNEIATRGLKAIPSVSFEKYLLEQIPRYLAALEKLAVNPPFVIMLTLIGVKNFSMAGNQGVWGGGFDRDVVLVPDILLEKFDCKHSDLRPMLDSIWNATGAITSPNFDAEGNWKPR